MLSKKQQNWKKWYQKNKVKRATYWKRYYKKVKHILSKRAKEYRIRNHELVLQRMRDKHPIHRRMQKLWHCYKVDIYTVELAVKMSGYRCDLCRRKFSKAGPQLDHCHQTGKIRGILCVKCNTGLGKIGDKVSDFERAIKYMKGELVK